MQSVSNYALNATLVIRIADAAQRKLHQLLYKLAVPKQA